LPSLTVRDETANNLADVLNFASPDIAAPAFNVPSGQFGKNCALPVGPESQLNFELRARAIKFGFKGVR
jgi:hypothetical protein